MKRLKLKEGVKFWLIISLIFTMTFVGTLIYLDRIEKITENEIGELYD